MDMVDGVQDRVVGAHDDPPADRGDGRDCVRGLRHRGTFAPVSPRARRLARLALVGASLWMGVFGCATLLQPSTQMVVMSSTPAGAEVWISETLYGVTPVEVALKPTGSYRVRFVKAGHEPFEQALAHEGTFGFTGPMSYPVTQLKTPVHVTLRAR